MPASISRVRAHAITPSCRAPSVALRASLTVNSNPVPPTLVVAPKPWLIAIGFRPDGVARGNV